MYNHRNYQLKGGGLGITDNVWGKFRSDKSNKTRELKQMSSDSEQDYLSKYLLFKSIHPFIAFSSTKTQNSNYASRDSLLVIGHWWWRLQNSFFVNRRLGSINPMYRFFISVLETFWGEFHLFGLKNKHFSCVQETIKPQQNWNLKKCAWGFSTWIRAFKWHQACISRKIILRGVAIWNIENMTFGKRLQKFENGFIVTIFHFALILITWDWIELFKFWKLFWIGKILLHHCEAENKSWQKSDLCLTLPF